MLAKRAWLLFFLAAIAFYLHGLGRLPLLGPDEPRYAQVAREMFMRADLITPTLGNHTWFEKPALLYWMMMASFSLFGVSEWAARLGPALSGLLSALIIYWMSRCIERAEDDDNAGGLSLWCGVTLLSSLGMIVFSYGASFDGLLTMTITAALAYFFVSELVDDKSRRRLLLAGFYAGVGASLLAKGLVGIVIPFGVVTTYFILRREWPKKDAIYSLLWGVPLMFIVASVWYGPVALRHGWTFIDEFFLQHHFARYVSNKYHHPQPFYFYLPVVALLALPWTPFLLAALTNMGSWAWRAPTPMSKLQVFALAWLIMPVLFFSISGSKLPGYVLPALPGAMLLVGERLMAFTREHWDGRWATRATAALLLLFATGGVIYASQTEITTITCALVIALPLAAAGLFSLLWTRMRTLCAAFTVCATFAAIAFIINCGVDNAARRESVRELIERASERGYTSEPVFPMLTDERTAEFYASGRLVYGPDGEPIRFDIGGAGQAAAAARRSGKPVLIIVPVNSAQHLTESKLIETEFISDNSVFALFVVRLPEQPQH